MRAFGPGLAFTDARRRRASAPEFQALLRRAAVDPAVAEELTGAYLLLETLERQALREAVEADAKRLGLDLSPLLRCWRVLDPVRDWHAWAEGDRLVFLAPGRATLHARGSQVTLQQSWTPGPTSRAVDVEEAVDRLASDLWSAYRAGRPLPRELGAFADLFDR
ncbi:MAG: hypothetical protein AAGE52_27700 [Myxococcota bacterium]